MTIKQIQMHSFSVSLRNKDNQPLKMKINPKSHEYAIRCHSELGPTFGSDIHIANNSNITIDSRSNLGYS